MPAKHAAKTKYGSKGALTLIVVHHKSASTLISNMLTAAMRFDPRCYHCFVPGVDGKGKLPSLLGPECAGAGGGAGAVIMTRGDIQVDWIDYDTPLLANAELVKYLREHPRAPCNLVFHMRHILDAAVSAFGSMTKTGDYKIKHTAGKKEKQELIAEMARQNALGVNKWLLEDFGMQYLKSLISTQDWMLASVADASERGRCKVWLSHYEDLAEHPKEWGEELIQSLELTDTGKAAEYIRKKLAKEKSTKIDDSTHVAHLHPGAYFTELEPATIVELMKLLTTRQIRESGYF